MIRRTTALIYCLLLLIAMLAPPAAAQGAGESPIALAIHGGAGTITRAGMTAEMEQAYRTALQEALETGYAVLEAGGTSMDAVVATIQTMEASPLFNSGRGAVFTHEGHVELDASIMDGATRAAGAVAGVQHVKSPIALARRVMEASPHVLLVGSGAEAFAESQKLEMVENAYFHTERRRQQLERAKARSGSSGDVRPDREDDAEDTLDGPEPLNKKYGTVGAVALDRAGNLAAGTSTGGMTNKRWGRVGDSPIIGAGTYADNATCAISATGHGEYFIRGVIAHDVAAMMAYGGHSLDEAARTVILEKLTAAGGTGGIIAMDRAGNIAMPFNTEGMYRGYIDTDGELVIEIYEPNAQGR